MFKLNDQVLVRRQMLCRGPHTVEVKLGTIVQLSGDGRTATVSLPTPDGRVQRQQVATSTLEAASATHGRAVVQFNPARRGRLA
jgi:hypothetical protein